MLLIDLQLLGHARQEDPLTVDDSFRGGKATGNFPLQALELLHAEIDSVECSSPYLSYPHTT